MNHKINFFVIPTLLSFNILAPSSISGLESDIQPAAKTVQLTKAAKGDVLRANLATGDDVVLKVNVNLEKGRSTYTSERSVEFPARLFLTDGENEPLEHADVKFDIQACCDSTPPKYVLPTEKPGSFESFGEYEIWFKKAYFTNQVAITFDVPIHAQELAPDLLKQLPNNSPTSYSIKGSYTIDNTQLIPDEYLPTVDYLSQRDKQLTTITLGGSLLLGGISYAIDGFQQQQPHNFIKDMELNYNSSRKIICNSWIATSTVLVNALYQEIPQRLLNSWPEVPSALYWVMKHRPDDLKQIKNYSCHYDNTEIPAYGKIFIADNEEETHSEAQGNEHLKVKDESDKEYRVSYRINNKPATKINKNIEGYKLACEMFLIGGLEYDFQTNTIKLVNDRFKVTTDNGVAG